MVLKKHKQLIVVRLLDMFSFSCPRKASKITIMHGPYISSVGNICTKENTPKLYFMLLLFPAQIAQ